VRPTRNVTVSRHGPDVFNEALGGGLAAPTIQKRRVGTATATSCICSLLPAVRHLASYLLPRAPLPLSPIPISLASCSPAACSCPFLAQPLSLAQPSLSLPAGSSPSRPQPLSDAQHLFPAQPLSRPAVPHLLPSHTQPSLSHPAGDLIRQCAAEKEHNRELSQKAKPGTIKRSPTHQ
jgi:hypothetical protein